MYILRPDARYAHELPAYMRHEDFIDGSPERVEKYLIRHMSEYITEIDPITGKSIGGLLWQVRTERLANDNFTNSILNHWLSYLTQPVTTTLEGEPWETIFDDITGFGQTLEQFLRQVTWEVLGCGLCAVAVEGPAETAQTEIVAKMRGERSYSTLYNADEIPLISRFTEQGPYRGNLSEVVVFTGFRAVSGKPYRTMRRWWIDSQGSDYWSQQYVCSRPSGIAGDDDPLGKVTGATSTKAMRDVVKEGVEFIEDSEATQGNFPFIPVVIFGSDIDESVIVDTVRDNREHMNKKSARDAINYYQAWQKVAFFGVDSEQAKYWTPSIAAFFKEPDGHLSAIEPGDPAALTEDLNTIKRDAILRATLQLGLLHQLATAQVQSAESKMEDKQAFEKALNYYAEILQRGMTQVLRSHAQMETPGVDPQTVRLTMARDFAGSHTDTELQEEALIYSWAEAFPRAGRKLKAEMLCAKVGELELAATKEADADLKQTLCDEIRAEATEAPPVSSVMAPLIEAAQTKVSDFVQG